MKALKDKMQRYTKPIVHVEDPVEAAKSLVSDIQRLVGIHNVFGDENANITIFSILSTLLYAGVFLYVGTISQFIYLCQVLPDKIESFKAINCLSSTSIPLSKYFFMWTSRARLRTVFKLSRFGLSSIPEGSAAQKKMLSTLQRGRYVSWLVIVNQIIAHVTYLLVPFLFTILGNDRYLPTTPGQIYGLTPKYETPFYEIAFIMVSLGTAFSVFNQTGYIVLFITLVAHDLGHFYAITQTLNDIRTILENKEKSRNNSDEEMENESVDKLLVSCVKHYQFLMHYHSKIRELYKVIFGAHFLSMTIVLVSTLQTLYVWDIRNTLLGGVTGIMPLFFYCFGGELLLTAGLEMSSAVYNCGWELMKVKQAKVVLLMLCLSQRPLYLTAADIVVMNRETFGKVVQVVYKIYAVFN